MIWLVQRRLKQRTGADKITPSLTGRDAFSTLHPAAAHARELNKGTREL
jgi:hypothetical protein